MIPRLLDKYRSEVVPALKDELELENVMAVPRLEKVVVNMGVGEAKENAKLMEDAVRDLGMITGQRPAIRNSRKSVAGFRLREGQPVGCMVTLRGPRMWEFLDRLINLAIPRIRDFQGLKTSSFDGRGNYSMGLTEQLVFPEVNVDDIGAVQGMDVTIVTSADTDGEGRALLQALGMPFKREDAAAA